MDIDIFSDYPADVRDLMWDTALAVKHGGLITGGFEDCCQYVKDACDSMNIRISCQWLQKEAIPDDAARFEFLFRLIRDTERKFSFMAAKPSLMEFREQVLRQKFNLDDDMLEREYMGMVSDIVVWHVPEFKAMSRLEKELTLKRIMNPETEELFSYGDDIWIKPKYDPSKDSLGDLFCGYGLGSEPEFMYELTPAVPEKVIPQVAHGRLSPKNRFAAGTSPAAIFDWNIRGDKSHE